MRNMYYVFLILQRRIRSVKPFGCLGFCESLARSAYRLASGPKTIDPAHVRLVDDFATVKSHQVVPGGEHGMANERLRGAIIESGLTLDQVGARLGVSAKTVERWIGDPKRKPYRRFQYAAASLLQCEMSYLWPEERTSAEVTEAGNAELIKLYPHRSVVPNRLWPQLYAKAKQHFDVLVYSGFWLTEDPAFHQVVKEKSAAGVSIRFMLGEPESPAVAVRGADEGIGSAMASKVRNALVNYGPLFDSRGSSSGCTPPPSTTRSTGLMTRCWPTATCTGSARTWPRSCTSSGCQGVNCSMRTLRASNGSGRQPGPSHHPPTAEVRTHEPNRLLPRPQRAGRQLRGPLGHRGRP